FCYHSTVYLFISILQSPPTSTFFPYTTLFRSPILGRPMAMMLLGANATVTICHSRTQNLEAHVRQADIVIGAVGKPEFIQSDWIKDNAVVVDAGYHPGGVGDIQITEALKQRVAAFTPVPGGVGPMTINTLILQTLEAGEKALS